MTTTNTGFLGGKAPCGRIVGGKRHREEDDDCLLTDIREFECGCRIIRHEFHDGSIRRHAVRCDGKVVEDESSSEDHN